MVTNSCVPDLMRSLASIKKEIAGVNKSQFVLTTGSKLLTLPRTFSFMFWPFHLLANEAQVRVEPIKGALISFSCMLSKYLTFLLRSFWQHCNKINSILPGYTVSSYHICRWVVLNLPFVFQKIILMKTGRLQHLYSSSITKMKCQGQGIFMVCYWSLSTYWGESGH